MAVAMTPMTMYLLVHDAIRREAAALEVRTAELDVDDHASAKELAQRVAFFERGTRMHEASEEGALFPAIEDRFPLLAEAYVFDHDHIGEHSFDVMRDALAVLESAEAGADRRTPVTLLRRAAVALNEHLWLHIEKENQLLVGHVQEAFTPEEQGALAGGMAAQFPPDLMGEMLVWMYRGQTVDDRETMVRALRAVQPPEVFDGVRRLLASAGTPDDWAALTVRVPELGVG